MLKIWGRRNSINVQKVMWTVHELGLAHTRIDAGLQYGVVNESVYRAMNPNGRVPTIDDDGFVLWESNAVVRYLVARYGPDILGAPDARSHALADSWTDWTTTVLAPPMTTLFWGLIRTPQETRDNNAIEAARQQMELAVAILDGRLARAAFVGGDRLTFGDIPAGCFIPRWKALPIDRGVHPNVERWYAGLSSRPAYQSQVMLPLS